MPIPRKFISLLLCFLFIFEQSAFAQSLDLSAHFANLGRSIAQSDKFRPLHLRYLGYDNLSRDFKLLLDQGDTKKEDLENKAYIEENTQTLLKYFFIGLTLPNDKFWVNLRPDSSDNILDPDLEKTDIGRIFLEADLQLKKDTAQWTSPQTKEGRVYWDKLYKKAGELFGTENITIPAITRPWIVPNEIIIRESPEGAYIYKATLKVMLEEDYLRGTKDERRGTTIDYSFNDPRLKELNQYSTQLIRETIIPKLTYEVNTSKRYAPLRQVYYSLILAQWFKQRYKGRFSESSSLFGRTVPDIDSRDLTNLTPKEPYDKQTYFRQYRKSFKEGEYNLSEPVYTPYGQSIRRYMSGGIFISSLSVAERITINRKRDDFNRPYLTRMYPYAISSSIDQSTDIPATKKPSSANSAVFTYTLDPFDVWMQKFLKPQEDFLTENAEIRKYYIEEGKEKEVNANEILKILPGLKQFKQMEKKAGRDFFLYILKAQQEQEKVPLTWQMLFSWRDEPPVIFYDEIRDLLPGYNLVRIITPVFRGFARSLDDVDMTEFFFINGVYVGYGVTRIINDYELEMQFQIFPTTTHQELGRGKVKGLSHAIFRSRLNLWANLTPDFRVSVEKHQFPDIDTPAFYLKLGFQPYFRPKPDGALDYNGGLVFDLSNLKNDSPKNLPSSVSSAVEGKLEQAKQYFKEFSKGFGVEGMEFGGLKELNNPKARAENINNKIYLNPRWLDKMPLDEVERVIAHEVQHTRTFFLMDERNIELGGLHENTEFQDLQRRIGELYDKVIAEKGNGIFAKPRNSYQANWELLSLLRGYQIYLKQIQNNIRATTQPYEFIEAFRPTDLDFLNEEWLLEITKYFKPEVVEKKIKITYEDLGYPEKSGTDSQSASSLISGKKGGADFRALPIATQQIKSLQSLSASPLYINPNLNLDKEWAQIQAIFNAGIRPSVQRLVEFSAAAAGSPIESLRMNDVIGLIADTLRQEEQAQNLTPTDPDLRGLLIALEA